MIVPHAIDLFLQRLNLRPHLSFIVTLVGFLGGRPKLVQVRLLMNEFLIHVVKFYPGLDQLLVDTIAAAKFLVQVPLHLFLVQISARLARLDDGQSCYVVRLVYLLGCFDHLTLRSRTELVDRLLLKFRQVRPKLLIHRPVKLSVVATLIVRVELLLLHVRPRQVVLDVVLRPFAAIDARRCLVIFQVNSTNLRFDLDVELVEVAVECLFQFLELLFNVKFARWHLFLVFIFVPAAEQLVVLFFLSLDFFQFLLHFCCLLAVPQLIVKCLRLLSDLGRLLFHRLRHVRQKSLAHFLCLEAFFALLLCRLHVSLDAEK